MLKNYNAFNVFNNNNINYYEMPFPGHQKSEHMGEISISFHYNIVPHKCITCIMLFVCCLPIR